MKKKKEIIFYCSLEPGNPCPSKGEKYECKKKGDCSYQIGRPTSIIKHMWDI